MFYKSDVLKVLQYHIGRDNGIHAAEVVAKITGSSVEDKVSERRLRTLVTVLRLEGHHVCAHPEAGYFIAANEDELNQTCEFLYERAMKSLQQVSHMKKVSLPDLRGQLKLPV